MRPPDRPRLRADFDARVVVTTGLHSVSPYPSQIGLPVMVRNWWNTDGGSGDAPLTSSRTLSIDSRRRPLARSTTRTWAEPPRCS